MRWHSLKKRLSALSLFEAQAIADCGVIHGSGTAATGRAAKSPDQAHLPVTPWHTIQFVSVQFFSVGETFFHGHLRILGNGTVIHGVYAIRPVLLNDLITLLSMMRPDHV